MALSIPLSTRSIAVQTGKNLALFRFRTRDLWVSNWHCYQLTHLGLPASYVIVQFCALLVIKFKLSFLYYLMASNLGSNGTELTFDFYFPHMKYGKYWFHLQKNFFFLLLIFTFYDFLYLKNLMRW
jgi:hypothetical protein